MGDLASRRRFVTVSTTASLGIGLLGFGACQPASQDSTSEDAANAQQLFFKISLAEWSLHKSIRNGDLTNLEFPEKARSSFGLEAVEYVSQLFPDKTVSDMYARELLARANDSGVQSLLIMVDHEGDLGDTDNLKRSQAVENHYKWVEAAQVLGCHSIRVNAAGKGDRDSVALAAIDGLSSLSEFAEDYGLNVIVENHGGYSSDGSWLTEVMRQVNRKNCGTLPDFGNFCVEEGDAGCTVEYDKYKGVEELMPFAFGVSAKSKVFDPDGNEAQIDYRRMLKIVKDAGYSGYIGIEYEGKEPEEEGIRKTLDLLRRVGADV